MNTDSDMQYSASTTRENFLEQAAELDLRLRTHEVRSIPSACRSLKEYVATFRGDENDTLQARIHLENEGLPALATEPGMEFLLRYY